MFRTYMQYKYCVQSKSTCIRFTIKSSYLCTGKSNRKNIKVLFWSAIKVLPDGVLISVLRVVCVERVNELNFCNGVPNNKSYTFGIYMHYVYHIHTNNKRKVLLLCYHKSWMFLTRQSSAVLLPQLQNLSHQRNILLSCYHKDNASYQRNILLFW